MPGLADWVMEWGAVVKVVSDDGLYSLTERQAALVMGWLSHGRFPTAWQDWEEFSEDIADEIESIYSRLCEPLDLSEVTSRLDTIISILENSGSSSAGQCCDSPGGAVYYPTEYPSPYGLPVPDSVVDSGWATDGSDYDGMRQYLCRMADVIIDSMVAKVDALQEIWAAGIIILGAIVQIINIFWSGGLSIAIGAAMVDAVAVYDALSGITDALVFDELRERLESLRSQIRCWLQGGLSSADFMAALSDYTSGWPLVLRQVIINLGWEPVVAGVYDGTLSETAGDVVGCPAPCSDSAIFNITGDIVSPVGWSSGDNVQSGLVLEVDLESQVIGTSDGWRSFGQLTSGASAVLKLQIVVNTLPEGSDSNNQCHYVSPLGALVPLTIAELQSGVVVSATEIMVTAVDAFQPQPPRPRLRITFFGVSP